MLSGYLDLYTREEILDLEKSTFFVNYVFFSKGKIKIWMILKHTCLLHQYY